MRFSAPLCLVMFGCVHKVFTPELDLAAFESKGAGRACRHEAGRVSGRASVQFGAVRLSRSPRKQCRVSVETRTNAYQVRTGDFPEEQLSVYVTARQYGSLGTNRTFSETLDKLSEVCQGMLDNHVIDHVLRPLARTIAMK